MFGSLIRAEELRCVQAVVRAAGSEQLLMRASLHDAPGFHDQDEVGISDGGQPVGDDEACSVGPQRSHRALHENLSAGVH
jgi:hypothetical protein